jgi:hypothetical protein
VDACKPSRWPISRCKAVEAQRASVTAEAGPALYLGKLFGSNDTQAVVRLITALLVLVRFSLTAAAFVREPAHRHHEMVQLMVAAQRLELG